MRLINNLLIGLAFCVLVYTASCCCTGGLDDDNIDQNLPHDQGGTHDQGLAT
jgi:hypothetical protein